MQNTVILATQNQVGRIAEQGSALSKNNEPNVSFKAILSSQPKPAEQAKTDNSPKADVTAQPQVDKPDSNRAPADQNVDTPNAASYEPASKPADTKRSGHTKTQAKSQKTANEAAEISEKSLSQTDATDGAAETTGATLSTADNKPRSNDKSETQTPMAATADANAAIIASLNLPAKDFLNAGGVSKNTVNTADESAPTASATIRGLTTSGNEAVKNIDLNDKTIGTADLLPPHDLQATTLTTQNKSSDADLNAKFDNTQFGQRLNAKLAMQENMDKAIPPALNALANQATQAMLTNNVNATQTANNISAYPGKTGWDQAISQKVVWMVGAAEQTATLTLNPPDLGPLQVVVNVNNDKADTTFISQNPEVRKALEDGMSNLRQLMDQAGIQLGQTSVNDGKQSAFFQQANREQRFQPSSANTPAEAGTTTTVATSISRVNNGLVDTFA